MQKIKITRATICGGEPVAAGKTISASDADARLLISIGKAVPVGGAAKKAEAREPELVKGLTTRNAAGLVRGKRGD